MKKSIEQYYKEIERNRMINIFLFCAHTGIFHPDFPRIAAEIYKMIDEMYHQKENK